MSRVTNQAVPPSLLADYQRLLRTTDFKDPAGRLVGLHPATRAAAADPDATPNRAAARAAARWLADRWRPNAIDSVRAEFFAARLTEILAGQYPTTYWWTPAPVADRTEYCLPIFQEVLTPENSSINPLYWDPTRQPQRCAYRDVDHRYNTPTPPGTEPNPAPGWKGQVQNGIWRDSWHAQRLRDYNLPVYLDKPTDRPVLLDLTATISAAASTRGHRNWFAIAIEIYNGVPDPEKGAVFLYGHNDRYDLAIPPADPNGWNYSLTRRLLRNAFDYWRHHYYGASKLSVRTATVPARGYYFARNDTIAVGHQIALKVAVARKP